MAMVDLKTVYRVTAKGRTYYYAWRGPGAPRLHAEPGSAEFIEELQAALAGRYTGDKTKVSGLCAAYRASDAWKKLSPKTRENWSPWLDRIQEHFGATSIAAFERPLARVAIRRWRDKYKATPRSADVGLEVLSRLFSYAIEEGRLNHNPISGVPRLYRNDRSMIIWTDEDLSTLSRHASPEVMRAARLAALTGLRKSDLLRLSWSHIGPLAIEIRTGKSSERKTTLIPIYGELRQLLAEIPKTSPVVLTNTRGLPWKTGFGSSWGAAIAAAEIDKHFHDLRGTAATKFYLADLTIREIAEIMTWSEDYVEALLAKYVKKDELLRDRIRRMDAAESGTAPAKPAAKPG